MKKTLGSVLLMTSVCMTLSQVSGVGALEQVPGSTDIQNSTATENNN